MNGTYGVCFGEAPSGKGLPPLVLRQEACNERPRLRGCHQLVAYLREVARVASPQRRPVLASAQTKKVIKSRTVSEQGIIHCTWPYKVPMRLQNSSFET